MADTKKPGRPWANALYLWVLGFWTAASIAMAHVATSNFRLLDPEILRDANRVYGALPAGDERRLSLRYAASELNRHFFRDYDRAQLAVGAAAMFLFVLARRRRRLETAGLVFCGLVALSLALYLTPELVVRGRAIDFVPRDPPSPEVEAFFRLHGVAVGLDLAKLAVLLVLAGLALRPPGVYALGHDSAGPT